MPANVSVFIRWDPCGPKAGPIWVLTEPHVGSMDSKWTEYGLLAPYGFPGFHSAKLRPKMVLFMRGNGMRAKDWGDSCLTSYPSIGFTFWCDPACITDLIMMMMMMAMTMMMMLLLL